MQARLKLVEPRLRKQRPSPYAWKIIDLELLEEKRIDPYANAKM